jgi:hypothetical protein
VAISPDGTRLAAVTTDGEQRNLIIQSLADGKVVGGLRAGVTKVRDVRWAGSDHVLVTLSSTGYAANVISPKSEWLMVIDYEVSHRRQKQLLTDTDGMNVVQSSPMVRIVGGRPYAYVEGVQFVDGEGVASLYKVDLDLDQSTLYVQASKNTEQWLVDQVGDPLAETQYDARVGRWTLKVRRRSGWRVVKTIDDKIGRPVVLGLGRDGKWLLISDFDGDEVAVRELAPDADDWGAPTLAQQGYGLIFDPVTAA